MNDTQKSNVKLASFGYLNGTKDTIEVQQNGESILTRKITDYPAEIVQYAAFVRLIAKLQDTIAKNKDQRLTQKEAKETILAMDAQLMAGNWFSGTKGTKGMVAQYVRALTSLEEQEKIALANIPKNKKGEEISQIAEYVRGVVIPAQVYDGKTKIQWLEVKETAEKAKAEKAETTKTE